MATTTAGTFRAYSRHIALGDTVIAYSSPKTITYITVTPDGEFCNSYGGFPHGSMVGKEWGSKIPSKTGKGFIYLLYPTPELWTLSLPHRTQILYQPDISFVTALLDLRPGVKMIEAGTGSGSFSHSIARTIASTGHLYTFEFSQDRYEKANLEFTEHGLGDIITIQHRDVCVDGFDMSDMVDANLPAPWDALDAAKRAFKRKKVGRICCFSPCMEQVLKTCTGLKELGFVEIQMYEVLLRPYDVRKIPKRSFPKLGDAKKGHAGAGKKRKAAEAVSDSDVPDGGETSQEGHTTTLHVPLNEELITSKPQAEVRGHTSYLTFATLLPRELPVRH
ncbi:hypothetical protein SpCBS45565_g00351 [Spizellomyces sp. 'palustris']|nr:hypothetical protein SpCBS45565_g00351 [Spizellomyces sp. 'palustris']